MNRQLCRSTLTLLIALGAAACGPPPVTPPSCQAGSSEVEPNDTIATADAVTLTAGAATISGRLCAATDVDHFSISLAAGDTIDITVTYTHANGDVDVELQDAAGGTLDSDAGITGTETLTYTAGAAETVYFQAYAFGASFTQNGYSAAVAVTPGAATPGVTITGPAADTTVQMGTAFNVMLTVANFTLVDPATTGGNVAGEGHYHMCLDSTANCVPTQANYLGQGFGTTVAVTIPAGTTEGLHNVFLSLRNNNHSAVAPAAENSVSVYVVDGAAPTISIACAAPGTCTAGVTAGTAIDVTVAATGVRLIAPAGTSSLTGHYHYCWDTTTGCVPPNAAYITQGFDGADTITVPAGAAVGAHMLYVSLRQNSHAEWAPATEDFVLVTVR